MATHYLKMPKLSPTMEQGTITAWHFSVGEKIADESIAIDVATDKANVEYQIVDGGWLRKILIGAGQSAQVGQPIALLTDEADEAIVEVAPAVIVQPVKEVLPQKEEQPKVAISPDVTPSRESTRVVASPLAKKLAELHKIDLHRISGTGPQGRITSRDLPLEGAVRNLNPIPLSPMRKVIARRLQESKSTVPHFYLNVAVEVSALVELYQQLKSINTGITYNDLIIKASALALQEHPQMNCTFDAKNEMILPAASIDISVAVTVEGGLLTPVVRKCEEKNVKEISATMKELATRAKAMKLRPDEYQGGSFTISNLGMFAIDSFAAIINPPQIAILAVSAITDQPVVKNGQVVAGKILELTLSVDHRACDGKDAAQFMQTLKKYLTSPALLLI